MSILRCAVCILSVHCNVLLCGDQFEVCCVQFGVGSVQFSVSCVSLECAV